MEAIQQLIKSFKAGDAKALARCITIVENELEGHSEILASLTFTKNTPLIGITGPPGAGKSTLVNAVISKLSEQKKKIGIVAIDPTSPFNYGSLLGDRLRMSEHFTDENIFIRSLATRGSLGGLSAKTIEITDVMRAFGFDYVFVETVGVGQSEVEIAGLADTTVLVLVPESGDDIQTSKSGIMEIADIFVVNKSDREGADIFMKNLKQSVVSKSDWHIPILKTIASQNIGIIELVTAIEQHFKIGITNEKKIFLLAEKAYKLIQYERMKTVSKKELQNKISVKIKFPDFNLYCFVKDFFAE
ncbi:MAG: methylmalonyl Co-A mutase-associated GTPase MeaB [Bacteroidia bacterium]